jgi:hypothetical protein
MIAGATWDRIGGDGTIVPMALNYSQQKALAMQWKAAGPALRKSRHAQPQLTASECSARLREMFDKGS